MTVINGPPERSRTRSPLRNGAAGFCVEVFDGAEAEKVGDKGTISATASITAIGTETICLVEASILNSILKSCGLLVRAWNKHVGGTVKAKVAISYL
jgi:hypothetical protein